MNAPQVSQSLIACWTATFETPITAIIAAMGSHSDSGTGAFMAADYKAQASRGQRVPTQRGCDKNGDRAGGPDGATAPRAKRVAKRAERAPGA